MMEVIYWLVLKIKGKNYIFKIQIIGTEKCTVFMEGTPSENCSSDS